MGLAGFLFIEGATMVTSYSLILVVSVDEGRFLWAILC